MANVPIYKNQGGSEMVVDTGATLTVNGTLATTGTITVPAGSIDTAELAAKAVTTAKIDDGAVDTLQLAADAVETAKIADGNVTFAKTAMFVSTEQTGDGMPQNIAHGLGATPAAVLIVPTDTAPATTGDYTATEGAHDMTNVVVTVTSGKKYKVWAMA